MTVRQKIERQTAVIAIRCYESEHAELRNVAEQEKIPFSHAVRELLNEAVAARRRHSVSQSVTASLPDSASLNQNTSLDEQEKKRLSLNSLASLHVSERTGHKNRCRCVACHKMRQLLTGGA